MQISEKQLRAAVLAYHGDDFFDCFEEGSEFANEKVEAIRAALEAALSAAEPAGEVAGQQGRYFMSNEGRWSNWFDITFNTWVPEPGVREVRNLYAAAPAQVQETNCARCGLKKHTPLRVDRMGGYVCLTCIDSALSAAEPVAAQETNTMQSDAAAKLELWFFRDMLESNRLRLFELFGFKPSEMDTMAKQQMVFRRILAALSTDAKPVGWQWRHPRATGGEWMNCPNGPRADKLSEAEYRPVYAAPPAPSVAVKALEWHKQAMSHGYGLFIRLARTSFGDYQISHGTAGKYEVYFNKGPISAAYDSAPEAKTAAQADYEARIRSALSAQVQDVAELDEKTIVRLAWENFSENDYGRLTYERAPPMFPQATYDVPTYALSQFVKAVRAAAPAKQEEDHD